MSDEAELLRESVPAPEGRRRHLALSASRASDYKACPLLYRFRAVDKLPEPPSPEAARGTLVHAVLEELFGLPPAGRTEAAAVDLVRPTWERLSGELPDWQSMLEADQLDGWLESARDRVRSYFGLEDPTRFSAESRELLLEVEVGDGVPLRGYLDRVDVAPNGALRIVDYKTGRAPGELFEQSALFQMKFYALLVLRTRGVVPHQLKLLYLGDSRWLTYVPSEDELLSFERTLTPLWSAMLLARQTGDFRPRAGKVCGWCAHHALCPEFGGTPPPYPFPDNGHPSDTMPSETVQPDAITADPPDRLAGFAKVARVTDGGFYYLALGDGRYRSTEHAGGAWAADQQHMGPVSGLLTAAIERHSARGDLLTSRIAFDILGAIPSGDVEVSVSVIRPGRTIELVEAEMHAGGRAVVRATAWRLATTDTAELAATGIDRLPGPESAARWPGSETWAGGFIRSLEIRQLPGWQPGRGRVWIRTATTLIDGESSCPLADFMAVVDTANGIAVRADPAGLLFPNTDLTVHLFRRPGGPWFGLDTTVSFGADGVGLTASVLHDESGPVGRAAQTLTLRRR